MVKLLSNEQQELHQVTLLLGVLLYLLAIFQDASLIAKLLKTFLEFLWGCLVGIVLCLPFYFFTLLPLCETQSQRVKDDTYA